MQSEFRVPTTDDGRPIPWVFGRVKLEGPNGIYQRYVGNSRIRRRSGPFSKTTTGYRYSWALHFGVSGEIETLHKMEWGGKTVLKGAYTATQAIRVRLGNLFGGDRGGGGIDGTAQLLFGAPDYVPDGLLLDEQPDGPGYRGQFSVMYRGLVGNGTTIAPTAFEVSRYTAGWDSGEAWLPEYAYVPLNEASEGEVVPEFSFMFVHPKAGVMDTVIPLSSITYRDLVDQQFNAWIDALESIKTLYGSSVKLNIGIGQYVTPGIASLTQLDAQLGDDFDLLRLVYSVQPDANNYFINDAATAIEQLQDDLDNAGVTGTPRILFVVTAGPDTPSFVDGPTFGTPETRLAALIANTTALTARTGAYAPASGRSTDVYRYNVQAAGASGLLASQLQNGPLSAARNLVPSGNTPMADIVNQVISAGIELDELPYFGANLAHVAYELITTPRPRGMGYTAAAIDEAAFEAAAQTFYTERLGLCIAWQFEGPIEDMLSSLQDHGGCIIDEDPITGLWRIKLLRGDYDPDTLPVFGPAEIISVDDYQRASVGELVTSIAVTYRDVFSFKDRTTPPLRDLALIQEQGAENLEKRDYPWLPTMSIAMRIADRDMQLSTLPLYTASVRITRAAYGVKPGDVIKLSDVRIGVVSGIVRVLAVDYGTLQDGVITVRVAEDRFGLAASVYAVQQPVDYTPPDTRPLPSLQLAAFEVPWAIMLLTGGPSTVPVGRGYVGALATPPTTALSAYDLYTGIDFDALTQAADGQFVPGGALATALAQTETEAVLLLQGGSALDGVEIGDYAIIGTGPGAEWARVTAVDVEAGSVTVARGYLDTTPALATWPLGTLVWIAAADEAVGELLYGDGDAVIVAAATVSPDAALDPALSPTDTVTLANRANRPLPPGNVQVNGEAYPSSISGALIVTWAHRDRFTQPADVAQTDATDYGPEAGTTYNVFAYDAGTDTLLDSDTGLAGTTWTPTISGSYLLRIEIEAERAGLASWQRQMRQFAYDGVSSEDGSGLITEGGALIRFE